MPLSPNFSVVQSISALDTFVITDTSTGTDVALTLRLIYITKYNSEYLVPDGTTTDYIVWPIGSSSLTIADILDKDYAVLINVKWFTGSSVTYTKSILCLFKEYGEQFLRQLTQAQAANRTLLNSKNFWQSKIKLRTLIDDAEQAVSLLNDQSIATFALDEAETMIDNPSLFW
jgi:hypothetical protein